MIAEALGENALIQLGSSSCISPDDIPIMVAVKGDDYEALSETDRAAFCAPGDFPPGTAGYLNAARAQVLLGLVTLHCQWRVWKFKACP